MSDLNNTISKSDQFLIKKNKILNLKKYIDDIFEEGKWDLDVIFKYSDFKEDTTFNCIIYYLAG